MAKKTKRKRAKKQPEKASQRKRTTRIVGQLMVVDQKPFLKRALARCQRIRRDLAKRQKILAAFEEEDLPAYQTWIANTFGAMLTEIRDNHEAIAELELWLDQIDFSLELNGVPRNEVYEYVRKHRDDPDYWDPRYDPDPKDLYKEEESSDEVEEMEDDEREMFDEMGDEERAMFEEFVKGIAANVFGVDAEELENDPDFPGWSPGSIKHKEAASAARKHEISELKQLYRRLARRLHPDVSKADEAVTQRRWEQLQTAYDAEDLDKLRALEAICDADDTGLSIKLGLANLNTWADYHQELLKPLQSAMRDAKKHPAWGFNGFEKNELIRYKKEIEVDFERECNFLKSRRLYLEDFLDSYRRMGTQGPRKAQTKQTRKKPSQNFNPEHQDEFSF